jgi:carbon-monoxide dehydrogenase medium subunit
MHKAPLALAAALQQYLHLTSASGPRPSLNGDAVYAFSYIRPTSLAEAIAFLQAHEEARPLSGGMTLIPTLKHRLAAPSHLVDIAGLPELKGIESQAGLLRIGAATRHVDIARAPAIGASIPALSALAEQIADPQVRNRGTLGGSVANNDPAADYPAAVLALNATIVTSQRRIAADDFFQGMFATALQADELIVAIEFPIPKKASYAKYRHRASGYAVVGVFVAQFPNETRVAVTGAGASVFRWREAEAALTADCSTKALEGLSLSSSDIVGDVHTSAGHKAHLVGVFARRAIAMLDPASGIDPEKKKAYS